MPLLPSLHEKYGHLKRVHDGVILLTDEIERLKDIKELQQYISAKECIKIKIPAKKPKTRKQYEEAKKYWPTAFLEDKILEQKINRIFFDLLNSQILIELYKLVELGGKFFRKFKIVFLKFIN